MLGFRKRWLWLAYLVFGLLLAGASLSLPDLPASVAYQLTGLSAVVAILVGTRLHRPARRGMWYGLAGGLGVFVAGDVVYSVYVYVLHREPFPSPPTRCTWRAIRSWRAPCW
jgi:diguanylate cyclase